ncbi:MAG TPA: hypothetical protein VGJ26_19665 [Pirellulales bacterium]
MPILRFTFVRVLQVAVAALLGACAAFAAAAEQKAPAAAPVDLTSAPIVAREKPAGKAEGTAVRVLGEEVKARSGKTWASGAAWPKQGAVVVVTAGDDASVWPRKRPAGVTSQLSKLGAEGYVVELDTSVAGQPVLWLCGKDPRGALFAVGHLLRRLDILPGAVKADAAIDIATAPTYPMRGHQIGYRARANSWDAWNERQFEQYIRELALFGANCVENIPFQDPDTAPHMRVPRDVMNVALSKICDDYDQDYWLWTPAEYDLTDEALRKKDIAMHAALYKACPRIDGIFFPGGDPGDNHPRDVLPFLASLYEELKPLHPRAKMWISLQGFDKDQVDYFYKYVEEHEPDWLGGVACGPSSPPIAATRKRLAKRYPIRHYPDITHTVRCQYPIPWWDTAYAVTLGRESPNPQPLQQSILHNWYAPDTIGFLSYSDGVHDDLNKIIWTALAWNPQEDVRQILLDYARAFFGPADDGAAADGIFALERNGQGALAANGGVAATLSHWQALEAKHPERKDNWRWQLCLVRANYDAFTRERLISERALEETSNEALAQADKTGANAAIDAALAILARADDQTTWTPAAREQYARIVALCDDLYRSIGLQTSVKKYHASGTERGCILDFVLHPLNNRWWLEDEFARIRKLESEPEKLAQLRVIREWEHPGEGSFYDDVGDPGKSPHVVRGETLETDPGMQRNPNPDFSWTDGGRSRRRLSWISSMDWPVAVKYEQLDPQAKYAVRTTGYRDALLRINGERVTPTIDGRKIGEIKEFDVPAEDVASGKLLLTFDRPQEVGLNWREQSRLTEIWLIKRSK